MGFDRKYGQVTTEFGDIPDDEPVIVFRARDPMVPAILDFYQALCVEYGSPARHVGMVADTANAVQEWQHSNPGRVKQPDSERSRAWLDH